MSTKKAHLYNMAWRELLHECDARGRPVTAGEFARRMGVARSTAVRWLTDMLAEGAIQVFRSKGKNGLPLHGYKPVPLVDI